VGHDIGPGLDALEQLLAVVRWKQPVDPVFFAPLAADLAARLRTQRDALAAAVEEIDYPNREGNDP